MAKFFGLLVMSLLIQLTAWAQSDIPQEALSEIRQYYSRGDQLASQNKIELAAEAYQHVINIANRYPVDSSALVDCGIKLATLWHKLEKYDDEQTLLNQLFEVPPPPERLAEVSMLQARLYLQQSRVADAYSVMRALSNQIPQMQWRSDDRVLYAKIKDSLNNKYQKNIVAAERLFDSGLYAESTPYYKESIEAAEQGLYPDGLKSSGSLPILAQLRYRLAQAYYLAGDYSSVIDTIEKVRSSPIVFQPSDPLEALLNNQLFLLGLSYRQAGRFEEAIDAYRAYLRHADKTHLQNYDQVQYELGVSHYFLGRYTQARSYLKTLTPAGSKPHLFLRSQLYLARIDIAEGAFKNAEKNLNAVAKEIKPNDDLHYELAYLLGEIAFKENHWRRAAENFEKALPKRNQLRAEWYPDTLYYLGWSYLKIASDSAASPTTQSRFFDKAEESFQKMADATRENTAAYERAYLALSQMYMRRASVLNDENAREKAAKILNREHIFTSVNGQAQALMLKAETTASFEKRQQVYEELTDDFFADSLLYPQGWFLRAMSTFEEGQRLKQEGDNDEASFYLSQAIPFFKKSFDLFIAKDKNRAAEALRFVGEALILQDTEESLREALKVFDIFIKKHHNVLLALSDPGEIFYLQGMAASRLQELISDDSLPEIVEQSLFQVITNFSQGSFAEKALYFLGTTYFQQGNYSQAQHMFNKLVSTYPHSESAGEAAFWASECADWLQEERPAIQTLRKRVFVQYPNSPHADEAYFTYYTYADYLQGGQDAIEHLKKMKDLFPSSPFLVNAYYLIGFDAKNDRSDQEGILIRHKELSDAIDAFEMAKNHFDSLFENWAFGEDKLEYFVTLRYRAALELALTHLTVAEGSQGAKRQIYLEYAENAFENLLNEFDQSKHPIASILKKSELFSSFNEEVRYGLSQVYIKGKNDAAAEKILTEMLEAYSAEKVSHGYLIAKIWSDLGNIAMRKNDFELALQFFHHAQEAAQGRILSAEQKLELWIQESLCHRSLGHLDEAMTILSNVINDDTISAQRLKAMYLRAELYEEQGRTELAVRQLEATSKKGGPWASKAKEKLEKDYGFR